MSKKIRVSRSQSRLRRVRNNKERLLYNGSRGYASFSGVNIREVLSERQIGNLEPIEYRITRDIPPIYVMGSVEPTPLTNRTDTLLSYDPSIRDYVPQDGGVYSVTNSSNIAVGYQADTNTVTGQENTFIGYHTSLDTTTGTL